MDNVFRTAQVEIPTTSEDLSLAGKVTDNTPDKIEKPLNEEPYLPELWNIGDARDHFEMPALIKEINDFVLETIERDKLEPTRKSYEEIIQKYEKRLRLPNNVDIYTRTEKVAELIRIDRKLIEAVRSREALLNSDPTKMTSEQLKKYLEMDK